MTFCFYFGKVNSSFCHGDWIAATDVCISGLPGIIRKSGRTPLSSRVASGMSWSPLSGILGVQPPVELERGLGIALQAMQEEKALSSQ